ncbi:MAG: cyclopropane-fatty-acyl-phospholipid synthase family protein [Burkholderiales bacterium]
MTTTTRAGHPLPFSARAVLGVLDRLSYGRLRVLLPNGARLDFGPGGPEAVLEVRDWRSFGRIVRRGDIGFAEGYLEGDWHTTDLARLLTLLAANRSALEAPLNGSLLGRVIHRLAHALRANTRGGSRRNIAAHYDLGNAFYSLWLDAGMTYSSALYNGDATRTLEDAQQAKYQRILARLALPRGAHVLEIGSGWGGFAELAAQRGLRVSGITLSHEQFAWATERLASQGLARLARFELRDYRDLHGRFDAVASIEMFEAVGERWWPSYFDGVAASLPRGGRAMVQTIVIDDALFENYRRGSDFIRHHIFPGGMLATHERFAAEARRAGLEVAEAFRFGRDYALTLAAWRGRFLARLPQVRALGFDERFVRMWEFYLAYCEAGFVTGSTDVLQYLLVRQ